MYKEKSNKRLCNRSGLSSEDQLKANESNDFGFQDVLLSRVSPRLNRGPTVHIEHREPMSVSVVETCFI